MNRNLKRIYLEKTFYIYNKSNPNPVFRIHMSNTNDIGIFQVKLNIRSLIPKQDNLILTSDMLNYGGEATLEKYPFFSTVHKYPRKKLQDMTYDKVLEFFFTLEEFRNKLKKRKVVKTKGNKAISGKRKTGGTHRNKYSTPAEILTLKQSNFVLMLQLLFPTVYPVTNNIDTSIGIITQKPEDEEEGDIGEEAPEEEEEEEKFEEVSETKGKTNSKNTLDTSSESGSIFDFKTIQSFFSLKGTSIFNFLPNRLKQNYSYLKIGGQDYTITRTIWLNDVMNHPVYSDVIKSYHLFEIWKENKMEIQDTKEKWNIVLLAFDTSVKTPELFEKIHDERNYYRINKPSRYDEQFENMRDFDDIIDKIKEEPSLKYIDIDPKKQKDAYGQTYKTQRKALFEKFKTDQKLYDYLEKLTIYLNRIKSARITNVLNTFLNNISSKISNLNKDASYEDYVNNLNFEYLSNPDLSGVADKIRTKYPEFNNFVNKIQNMKARIIDNVVWKQVIASIMKGSKYHNFQSKIWNKIDACYGLNVEEEDEVSDDEEEEEDHEVQEEEEDEEEEEAEVPGDESKKKKKKEEKQKKKEEEKKKEEDKIKKIGKCSASEKVFYVNFDQVTENDPNKLPDMKLIDIYLQMDVIEGKIDDKNKSAINCDYTNTDLGNIWQKLINGSYSWDLTQQMFFYSAKKQLELFDKKNSVIGSSDEDAVKK